MVDYISPALCTPITPFPPIGDAAYHQHAGEEPSHGHRRHAQKFGKDCACGSGDMLSEIQTHRQTYSSQYFATAHAGEVIKMRKRSSEVRWSIRACICCIGLHRRFSCATPTSRCSLRVASHPATAPSPSPRAPSANTADTGNVSGSACVDEVRPISARLFIYLPNLLWLPTSFRSLCVYCLQCFDTVGWASGRACGV